MNFKDELIKMSLEIEDDTKSDFMAERIWDRLMIFISGVVIIFISIFSPSQSIETMRIFRYAWNFITLVECARYENRIRGNKSNHNPVKCEE